METLIIFAGSFIVVAVVVNYLKRNALANEEIARRLREQSGEPPPIPGPSYSPKDWRWWF